LDRLKEAKVRVLAKQFIRTVPYGFAIPVPDKMLDSLSDEEVKIFFSVIRLKLRQVGNYWELK
jgi:hypothetical protein